MKTNTAAPTTNSVNTNVITQRYQQSLFTVLIGSLVAINFALAKFAVQNGLSPFSAFYWQLLGAVLLLLSYAKARRLTLTLKKKHLQYYLLAGLFGVSGPNLLSNWVLIELPASTFTVLVTLSPLFTFTLSALFERKQLSRQRLVGILVGFSAILLVSAQNLEAATTPLMVLLLALIVPLLLAVGNVYRSIAYPADSNSLSLAFGMLLSQVLLLTPIYLLTDNHYIPFATPQLLDAVVIAMAVFSALSYLFTFRLQQLTDSVGFSQVGYFVTLTGVVIGILLFGEQLSTEVIIAIVLLFTGLAITNGHLSMPTLFRKSN